MTDPGDRIVVLIDMDCFFCQVETRLQPQHTGKPLAVVQYNQWEMGGIIAVNYEARSFGVTRHMRGKEAKEKCPDVILVSVPCLRGKADTTRYRKAGREVIEVIKKHCCVIERASVDEAYMDITNIVDKRLATKKITLSELISSLANTYIVGYSEINENDEEKRRQGLETWILNSFKELHDTRAQRLAIAGVIVEEIRASIYEETGFRCSAGISQNKILAKLACGLHKPNRQTILPEAAIPSLYSAFPVKKVRNLGGKFGNVVIESLGCNVMSDLLQYSLEQLQKHFDEKTSLWLYNIARGVDNEPVTNRLLAKSIGACKKFPGKQAITSIEMLKHWASDLAAEVCERLEEDLVENQRRATLLTISYHYYQNRSTVSQSRSLTLTSYKPEKMASHCVNVVTKSTQCPVAYLGISVGKFVPSKESDSFLKFFQTVKTENNDIACIVDASENTSKFKSNFNVKEKKFGTSEEEQKKKEKPLVIVTSNNEDSFRNEKTAATAGETATKANGRTGASLNASAEDSPTSQKVFKLMQVCKENDKIKSRNKRPSSMRINTNDFQNSFFMNVFKTGTKDHSYNINESINVAKESKRDERSTITPDAKDLNTDESTNGHSSDLCVEEHSSGDPTNETREHEDIDPAIECNGQTIAQQNPLVRENISLREIFPNVEDIDPNILLLLPANLQEEARSYMRSCDKKQKSATVKVAREPPKTTKNKSSKSKVPANKSKRRDPLLYNYLIKINPNVRDVPLKRCAECGQMIPATKHDEHTDFHVAQDLWREINRPAAAADENGAKRKLEDPEVVVVSTKRQMNTREFGRDARPISTFLS